MRPSTAISFLLAAIVGACSNPNPDHCANNEGHKTCVERGGDTKYCSKCVADNNGCVSEPIADDKCDAGSTSDPGTSTGDPSTTGNPTSSTSSSTSSSSSTSIASTTDLSTSDPSTSSSGDLTTSTGTTTDVSTSSTTTETMGTTLETVGTTFSTDTQSTEIPGTTSADTDDTTTGPMCGDNTKDPGETCDGTDLGAYDTCVEKNSIKYGGGLLSCAPNCNSYDESKCCVASGQAGCKANGPLCCMGSCLLGSCT